MTERNEPSIEHENMTEPPETRGEPADQPDASPGFFANPQKGRGVRRLNYRPLYIVGAVVTVGACIVIYNYAERVNANKQRATSTAQAAIPFAATPPRRPPSDYIEPELTPRTADTAPAEEPAAPAATTAEPSEAYRRRIQLIQRIEDKKLADLESALNADGAVQNFGRTGQQVAQGRDSPAAGGLGRMTAAGQPGAGMDAALMNVADGYGAGGRFGDGYGGGSSMAVENQQLQKRAFLNTPPETDIYLPHRRQDALIMTQEVKAGTVIPGVMITGLNSDLPGKIIGQVREDVYDSATGTQLLIPAGARLFGTYDSNVSYGQGRALVAWERIIYPDGSSITINRMPGADGGGYAGFEDQVNNHYGRIFGSAILLSVFSAGIQLSQPQAQNGENYNSSQIIAGALGQQLGQLGMQLAQRNLNIQPTIEIRPGYAFNVVVTKDMILPTWRGHPMAADSIEESNN